jgi:tRNA A-37 threonylcarbamoyl transferase component Bud32
MTTSSAEVDGQRVKEALIKANLVESEVSLTSLSGGVSSQVWLATSSGRRVVAKTPLAKLATPLDWFSDISRGQVEADSLRLLRELTPEHVPEVLFFDPDLPLLVLEAAPIHWRDWRQVLLSESDSEPDADGFADLQTIEYSKNLGAKLGRLLAIWHSRTTNVESLPDSIKSGQRLQQLRTNPFHRATAAAIGDSVLAARLLYLAEELESTRKCLVYGDFSPKNFLVANDGLWVIDAETAHISDPVLDLAFLNAHLNLKAMRKPGLTAAMKAGQSSFMGAYLQTASGANSNEGLEERLSRHTGAILAARVLGVSQANYLSDTSRQTALGKAKRLLGDKASYLIEH